MKKWLPLLFVLIITSIRLTAQTTIQGQVISNTKPIKSASVTIQTTQNKTILAYAFTDENGFYKLTVNKPTADSLLVIVKGFNIAQKQIRIVNKSCSLPFDVSEKEIELKQVSVKAQKITANKDTINYNVAAFTDKKDFVISDVLKKMPGISVAENGIIFYQGKPISKFYIENLDLLNEKYGIATNNVQARDVATVQVLEHHEPIKAKKDEQRPENAAINLKLKDEAKGKWSVTAKLGLGATPLLWDNEIAAMRFDQKAQNISTFKSNNAGTDLSNELKSFDPYADNLLGTSSPSVPRIQQKRYLYNNSNTLTANQLLVLKDTLNTSVNLAYLNNYDQRQGNSTTTYYLPESQALIIEEGISARSNTDQLQGSVNLVKNKTNYYFANSTEVSKSWDKTRAEVQTLEDIRQSLNSESFTVNNELAYYERKSKKTGIDFNSSFNLKSAPQALTIVPGMYADIFNNGTPYSSITQNSRVQSLNFNNRFVLRKPIGVGKWTISPSAELNVTYKGLTSTMTAMQTNGQLLDLSADSLKNERNYSKYNAKLNTSIQYFYRDFLLNINLPIDYHLLQQQDKISLNKPNFSRVYFQPQVSLKYSFDYKLDALANFNMYSRMGDMMSQYSGYILSGYRNLGRNDGSLYESWGNTASINVQYRDIVNMFFLSSGINYSHSTQNMLFGDTFNGILSVLSSLEQETTTNQYSISALSSKGFDWKSLTLMCHAQYGISTSTRLQQNQLLNFRTNSLAMQYKLDLKPVSFLKLNYQGNWSNSRNLILNSNTTNQYNVLTNELSVDADLSKTLIVSAAVEHYYNSASQMNKNLSFMDVGMTYIWGKTHLSLECNNLFNTRNYATYFYDAINSYQTSYHIRPLTIMLRAKFGIYQKNKGE